MDGVVVVSYGATARLFGGKTKASTSRDVQDVVAGRVLSADYPHD